MTRSARDMQTAHHEALHVVGMYILLGPECIALVTRKANGRMLGCTKLADLPHRHPALNAADRAVVALLPLYDERTPIHGHSGDIEDANVCAETAYKFRPDHERSLGPDEWVNAWLHGPIARRIRELLDSSRFRKLVFAVEHALDSAQTLEAHEVRELLERAEG